MPTAPEHASLIVFPCHFPIKVMGRAVPGLADALVQLAQQTDPGFDPATVELRPSKAGNYLGVTLQVYVTSQPQLDDLYRRFTAHPDVKVVL